MRDSCLTLQARKSLERDSHDMRFKRLQHLLQKSNIYSKFLLTKMEQQQAEVLCLYVCVFVTEFFFPHSKSVCFFLYFRRNPGRRTWTIRFEGFTLNVIINLSVCHFCGIPVILLFCFLYRAHRMPNTEKVSAF